jgi:hypothetical protein
MFMKIFWKGEEKTAHAEATGSCIQARLRRGAFALRAENAENMGILNRELIERLEKPERGRRFTRRPETRREMELTECYCEEGI